MAPNPFRVRVPNAAGQQERIVIKSAHEIELMRRAGKITAEARALAGSLVRPGVTTQSIDREVSKFIRSQGAVPSFYRYNGFPASVCISVNEEVIHGIPGKRLLKEGDIVSVDVGAFVGGYHGDCAATFPCGQIDPEAQRLIDATRQSFFEGIAQAREGNRLFDVSAAVQGYVESRGYSVVREYVGHGVGAKLHEPPEVPNYVPERRLGGNPRLLRGMVIAVEPMVNAGAKEVRVLDNKWTVVTKDGSYAAHYENTILITDGAPEILTAPAI
ncbi:MAG: type I methionyl aminopeptidase [Oscillibacter sp.]|nr:type I methionyl aminopeptidase [Oscillibacter sp.]